MGGIIAAMFTNIRDALQNSSATRLLREPPDIREMRRLFKYLCPYRMRMTIAILALGLNAVLGLFFPWILQNLINTILGQQNFSELNRITTILLLIFLFRAAFGYLQNYELTVVSESIVRDLRIETYAQLNRLSLQFYTDRRVGELISRLSSDVTMVRAALTGNIAALLFQTINFLGSLGLMLLLNARLTLFILLLAPPLSLSAVLFGRQLRKMSTKVQDHLAESNALVQEALSAVRVVKAFGREPYEVERYRGKISDTFTAAVKLAITRSAFSPLVGMMVFTALAATLWFGGREVLDGRLDTGKLIAFLVYGLNIASAMNSFARIYANIQEAMGAARRIFELFDEKPDIDDQPGAITCSTPRGQITFDDISFAYPDGEAVLHHIQLDVQPGEILALVGPSGAGKSTLFNLIPRFYDPTSGRILLDGHDLRDLSVASLRAHIGLVPQDTQLFSGTIRENLHYGKLDARDSELEEAARAANADGFIQQLPQGFETRIGERGVKLSGGQRQRIAIARTLLKDPRILLLDEATSSLDSESEGLVQIALERLMRGRTTVIIAHRLSTIQRADRIAVLNKGQLVELGTHAELLAKDGLYAYLYRLQFKNESSV